MFAVRPANQPPAEKLAAGVAHVDMSAVSVDLDKYNDKYEQIAPASSMSDSYTNKQKLNQKSKQQGKPKKSKHEMEQEKLKKLEIERQRRQKLEITIPDEITVGDLALKQTYECISKAFGSDESCYRVGGDEFACIFTGSFDALTSRLNIFNDNINIKFNIKFNFIPNIFLVIKTR